MGTNKYFNTFRVRSEQNLLDDLLREVIQIHGIDMLYLPRTKQRFDIIFGEDVLSKFDDYYDIEMYYESYSGYQGRQEFISKFGLEIQDQATIIMARSRFDEIAHTELVNPREGDLIFDPMSQSLWEIKYVNVDEMWFPLGDLPIYKFKVEKFVYSQEEIETGLQEIDQIEHDYSFASFIEVEPGAGQFLDNEWIFQGTSLATATAKAEAICWDVPPNNLKVINMVGKFLPSNGAITGATSGTSRTLAQIPDLQENNQIKDIKDNKEIQTEANQYLDYSEPDIFGFLKDNE